MAMPTRWLEKRASAMVSDADHMVTTPTMTRSAAGMSCER